MNYSNNSNDFNPQKYRLDFPILQSRMNGKNLIYLDNAATTQKPKIVIDKLSQFYLNENANIHRGIYRLSEQATIVFEKARKTIQKFINASSSQEIVFLRGATEAINLVAQSYGQLLSKGDEILITQMEHHSNIVPWQILCQQIGAKLKVVPMNSKGNLIIDDYKKYITAKTKFISITHISNALGIINPIKEMITYAHINNIPVLVDAAQSVPHTQIDVQDLDCDFLVFSGHKIYGPTGTGILFGKKDYLDKMPPYQGGGDMISSVTFEKTTYNDLPYKFEAGTPNIAGTIGLATAIEYVSHIGLHNIMQYENSLFQYANEKLRDVEGLTIIGDSKDKSSIISFVLKDIHPHDIGSFLNEYGIAIRAGHHCAMPVMKHFNVPATVRMSISFYNTSEEIDILVQALKNIIKVFI